VPFFWFLCTVTLGLVSPDALSFVALLLGQNLLRERERDFDQSFQIHYLTVIHYTGTYIFFAQRERERERERQRNAEKP